MLVEKTKTFCALVTFFLLFHQKLKYYYENGKFVFWALLNDQNKLDYLYIGNFTLCLYYN